MKTVLIIEDDEFKANSLRDFMLSRDEFDEVKVVSSLVEAIDAINAERYKFILIDMAIPSHPLKIGGGTPISLLTGGIEVLLELNYLDRSDPCVIITQYPDIEISGQFYSLEQAKVEIEGQLECSVMSCIEYREGDDSWKKLLEKVLNSNEHTDT
ncbi:response regulator [Moritella viscosa]|uniref:Putative orphan protein n=1 Tax=Moritella viscosa TaxID=80854 RepID=A0A1L0AZF1_9GAMM|nr:response regulator [Moritella viscosa]SGY89106.1 Putative orphan protein [Moritella viscosa]